MVLEERALRGPLDVRADHDRPARKFDPGHHGPIVVTGLDVPGKLRGRPEDVYQGRARVYPWR